MSSDMMEKIPESIFLYNLAFDQSLAQQCTWLDPKVSAVFFFWDTNMVDVSHVTSCEIDQ